MMNKNVFLISSLVISVLYLIYIIFEYYGLKRIIEIKNRDKNFYIENYKNLEKACKERCVVVLVIDGKKKIKDCLISILDQTVRVDDLIIFVESNETNETKHFPILSDSNLHNLISKVANISFILPNSSLHHALAREREKNTKLVFLTDEYIYGKNFIQKMIEKSGENKRPVKLNNNEGVYILHPNDLGKDYDIIEYSENWRL